MAAPLLPIAPSRRARLSYLALYSITHHRAARHRLPWTATTPASSFSTWAQRRSDIHGQPYSSIYSPDEPIRGPFSKVPVHERPKITPTKLKAHLDKYVVGQSRPKKRLSTAVFNHYQRIREMERQDEARRIVQERRDRIMKAQEHSQRDPIDLERSTSSFNSEYPTEHTAGESLEEEPREELVMEKSNVLLLGPTGVGKSLMMKTIARVLDVPFSVSDVTAMTQAGYIGQDVESCVERLLVAADYDVTRAERGIIFLDEIDKLATSQSRISATGRDVGGEGVQQALLKIIEGTTIQITPRSERSSARGPGSPGNFGAGYTSSGAGGAGAPKPEVYSVRTDNILFFLAGAFVGLDKIIQQRISRGSLGFGAHINSTPKDDAASGVAVVAEELYQKHSPRYLSDADLDDLRRDGDAFNILDLATPADLKAYGFIPELIGRVPVHVPLNPLSQAALVRILTEPRNSLVAQYTTLFWTYGVELHFTTPALHALAAAALRMGTGARALRTVLEAVLEESMHVAPDGGVRFVLVDEAVARKAAAATWFTRSQVMLFHRLIDDEERAWRRRCGVADDADADADDHGSVGSFEQYRGTFTSGL